MSLLLLPLFELVGFSIVEHAPTADAALAVTGIVDIGSYLFEHSSLALKKKV